MCTRSTSFFTTGAKDESTEYYMDVTGKDVHEEGPTLGRGSMSIAVRRSVLPKYSTYRHPPSPALFAASHTHGTPRKQDVQHGACVLANARGEQSIPTTSLLIHRSSKGKER